MLKTLPADSVQCCVTSPPYFNQRDYGHEMQIGLERDPQEFIGKLVDVFSEVRRVLRPDGTCWVNIGDSYAAGGRGGGGSYMNDRGDSSWQGKADLNGWRKPPEGLKPKDLLGIPWMLAFALRADGWYLRSDVIWHKPTVMPESVKDRPTKAHEHVFLLSKSPRYYYDWEAISEPTLKTSSERLQRGVSADHKNLEVPGRTTHSIHKSRSKGEGYQCPDRKNKRDVWTIAFEPSGEEHYAAFPSALPELCILAGSRQDDPILDPFCGSGTTGIAAAKLLRNFIGIELNPKYVEISRRRLSAAVPLFNDVLINDKTK